MPSPFPLPPPAASPLLPHHRLPPQRTTHLTLPLVAAASAIFFVLLFAVLYRKLTRKRTAPAPPDHDPPAGDNTLRRFSFSLLRRSTSSFSPSNRLGQGGSGSVYSGVLPSGENVAVKVMDTAGSEREFQNELSLASRICGNETATSPAFVVSILGYSSDKGGQRKLLVYELMKNGSLQDKLIDHKCLELFQWKKRFKIVIDVARALHFLHNLCGPTPVIHGDVMPSNVLLDSQFNAKLGDFGLARVLDDEDSRVLAEAAGEVKIRINDGDETESLATGFEEITAVTDQSPEKEYVMEWIGSGIKKERSRSKSTELIGNSSSADPSCSASLSKKHNRRLSWWTSLDGEDQFWKKEKSRQRPREWWREEFCEELARKNKNKNKKKEDGLCWRSDEDPKPSKKKKRRSSLDGGISSTPSMRGTVCYIAPEFGGGGRPSEKCDVYSFGVLVLVVVSGRRPLQVTESPMAEFERGNLVSWARQLAWNGRLMELVDSGIEELDREQALLCITVALLCLQRSSGRRPGMKEVVEMLSGEAEPPPCLPFEFSPSPPTKFPSKSRKKAR